MLARIWKKGNHATLWVGLQFGAATIEIIRSFLKTLKIELLYDPAIPLLGIYPPKNKNTNSKRYMRSIIHSSIIQVFDTHPCQKYLSLSEVPQLCSQGGAVPEATRVISDTSLGTELTGQEGKSPFS